MEGNEIPEVYIDQMRITVGVFGVSMTFALSEAHPTSGATPSKPAEKVRIRTSLEHAKVMTMLMKKQLKQYEDGVGVRIGIPSDVFTGLGIAESDW